MKHGIRLLTIISVLLLSACQKDPAAVGGREVQTQTGAAVSETDAEAGTEPEAGIETGADSPESEVEAETQIQASELPGQSAEIPPFKEVNYCYHNGLEYESVYFQDRLEYLRIDGLKDENVQKKINERIMAAARELYERELPPYRGIKVMIPDGEKDSLDVDIYSYVYYNQANILSILMRKSLRTADYSCYVEDVLALNFDLRTGREIMLADLFTEGYDYQSQISEYVRTCISENLLDDLLNNNASEYSSGFTLLRPFETIREAQKFIISSDDEIYLLLDYETREFDVGTQVRYLPVYSWLLPDQGRELVYTYRYETWDGSLYKDGFDRSKSLKTNPDIIDEMWVSDTPRLEYVQFRTYMPREIDNRQLYQHFSESVEQVEERALAVLEQKQMDVDDIFGGDYSVSVNQYGRYLVEREGYSFWNNEDYIYDSSERVYDGITGKEITLGDCFKPGVDYRELIISLVMAEDSGLSRQDLVRGLKEPEFVIYPSYLMITYLRNDSSYGLYESSFYVDFKDLGEENLAVFD